VASVGTEAQAHVSARCQLEVVRRHEGDRTRVGCPSDQGPHAAGRSGVEVCRGLVEHQEHGQVAAGLQVFQPRHAPSHCDAAPLPWGESLERGEVQASRQ
jgi:hypothetical protein